VLHDVGLDGWALTYDELSSEMLDARLDALAAERDAVARTLQTNLPRVVDRARRNLHAVERAVRSGGGDDAEVPRGAP
jgi:hypothetical protein